MLVRFDRWRMVRDEFSADERALLNRHITGQVLCPSGVTLDEDALPAELLARLRAVLGIA